MDYCPYCNGLIKNNVCTYCEIIFTYSKSKSDIHVCRNCGHKNMIKPSLIDEYLYRCEFCGYYYYVGPENIPPNDDVEFLRSIELTCEECGGRVIFIEQEGRFICQQCGLIKEFPVERSF